jgi:Predicted permeases
LSLITPILVLNLGFCAISAAVNLEYAPRCRVAYNQLRYQLTTALLNVPLPEGRPITFFNDYIISIGKNRNQKLQDILVFHLQNETNVDYVLRAPRGQVVLDATNQQIVLRFFDAKLTSFSSDTPVSIGVFTVASDLNSSHRTNRGPGSITDMAFSELRAKLRDLERRVNLPPRTQNTASTEATEKKKQLKGYRGDMLESIRVQIHRQVAFSFACFGFTLIGIPLGIRVHRRETNIGIAVALGLVLVYYSLIVVAQSLTNRPDLAPHLWMWVPNFLFQVIGAVLLWRANRGT